MKSEQQAKSECYDDIYDEFYNHIDDGECRDLVAKIFQILRTHRDEEGMLVSEIDKYFNLQMVLITEAEKTAKHNIDNKDDWQAYLTDNGLTR